MGKRRLVAITFLVVIVAFSVVASISFTENFPFRTDLTLTMARQTDSNMPEFDYIANITDDQSGFIWVRVEPEISSNQHQMYLEIQNPNNVELDTITLTFQSSQIAFVYFNGDYDVSYTYSFVNNDCDVAMIHVNNNSGAASGGSQYRFILTTQGFKDDFSMHLDVDLSMHYKLPLLLTEIHVTAPLDIALHQEN